MENRKISWNRRTFIKSLGAAPLAIPSVVPSSVFGETAPSKRITLGFIGVGAQGSGNLRMFLNQNDAHVVAVSDAYLSRAESAAELVNTRYGSTDCKVYQDFRKVIEDPSIDAVVISTPDHWHVPMSLMALEAGKDVFCEKPTLCIEEGRTLFNAVEKHGAIFGAGVEDRSLIHFHKMVEWVKNGEIGTLRKVDVTLPKGFDHPLEDPAAPPADLDWNLWQGPAAFHDFTPKRTDGWHWRYIRDYSLGALLDMGTHLVDTAQLGVNAPEVCPITVEGTGLIPENRESSVPVTFDLKYLYSHGVEMSVKNGPGAGWSPNSCFLRFEGDDGWIQRKTWSAGFEASDKQILRTRYAPEETKHWPLPPREQRNFLDCVKSRKPPTYPALDLHHMSTTLHMGAIAIALGRKLTWDPEKEQFDDQEANAMRHRPTSRDWAAEA